MTAQAPFATSDAHHELGLAFARTAVCAGAAIASIRPEAGAWSKADRSPVTAADLASNATIVRELSRICSSIPIISEEGSLEGNLPGGDDRFILVDPLDGTKEFLSGTGEYTVNIALVDRGQCRCGTIYAPALGKLWWGGSEIGSYAAQVGPDGVWSPPVRIESRPVRRDALVAVASRTHRDEETDRFLAAHAVAHTRSIGSSLKFCLLAEAAADVYPRFGPTMEWDTAAGQAILEGAGGRVETLEGARLTYGKVQGGYRNGGFIAWGRSGAASEVKEN